MKLPAHVLFFYLAGLGIYVLVICIRGARHTRGSRSYKPYLYVLGAILTLVLVLVALFLGLATFVFPH